MSADTNENARWREVRGRVLRSEVDYDSEHFRPVVEYEYTVDGVSYRGDAIVVGPMVRFNWKGPAKRQIARFPVGATVTVYVEPTNPQRSALQPSADKNLPLLIVVLGFFAFLLGIALVAALIKR